MIQKDMVMARVSTIEEWADEYLREASSFEAEGCRETAFLLMRVSKMMQAMVGNCPFPSKLPDIQDPPEAVPIETLREDG